MIGFSSPIDSLSPHPLLGGGESWLMDLYLFFSSRIFTFRTYGRMDIFPPEYVLFQTERSLVFHNTVFVIDRSSVQKGRRWYLDFCFQVQRHGGYKRKYQDKSSVSKKTRLWFKENFSAPFKKWCEQNFHPVHIEDSHRFKEKR